MTPDPVHRVLSVRLGALATGDRQLAAECNWQLARWGVAPDDPPCESAAPVSPKARSAVADAAAWLEDYLRAHGGDAPSADIKHAGLAVGHSADALKRARQRRHIAAVRVGFPRRTRWALPQSEHPPDDPHAGRPA